MNQKVEPTSDSHAKSLMTSASHRQATGSSSQAARQPWTDLAPPQRASQSHQRAWPTYRAIHAAVDRAPLAAGPPPAGPRLDWHFWAPTQGRISGRRAVTWPPSITPPRSNATKGTRSSCSWFSSLAEGEFWFLQRGRIRLAASTASVALSEPQLRDMVWRCRG